MLAENHFQEAITMTKNATSKTTSNTSNSTSAKQSTSERATSEKMSASQALHGAKSYGKTRDCHNTYEEDEYEDEE